MDPSTCCRSLRVPGTLPYCVCPVHEHQDYDRPDIAKKYLITQTLIGTTSLALALSCPQKDSKVWIDPDCEGHERTALNISFGLFLSLWIWQIFDVIANGKSYLENDSISFQMSLNENQKILVGINFSF